MSFVRAVQTGGGRFAVVLNLLASSLGYQRLLFFSSCSSKIEQDDDEYDNRNTSSSRLRSVQRPQHHHTVSVGTMPTDTPLQQLAEP